jgi:glycosyltransferase involved in cell wall biosynthesis
MAIRTRPNSRLTGLREPSVSLLLPNYNNARVLGLVLDRLAENTTYANSELVIVEDGSTDESPRIIRDWIDTGAFVGEINFIEKPNGGAIDSLNTALQAATGELVVQLDSDATLETRGWVERMLAMMQVDDRVGVVCGKVVMEWGEIHACGVHVFDEAGARDRPVRLAEPVGRRVLHQRVTRYAEGTAGDVETRAAEVDAAPGTCMMYRRADALEAGGYDTGYAPVWLDDIDLCVGIRKLGRKAFYIPDVRVVHYVAERAVAQGRERLRPAHLTRAVLKRTEALSALKRPVERAVAVDLNGHLTRDQVRRCHRHYEHWRGKWGWDYINPDVAEIKRRYGGTEICWAWEPDLRAAGAEIVSRYEHARAPAAG